MAMAAYQSQKEQRYDCGYRSVITAYTHDLRHKATGQEEICKFLAYSNASGVSEGVQGGRKGRLGTETEGVFPCHIVDRGR